MSYKKYDIQHCKQFAATKNGRCISTSYKGSKKMEWECEFGHRWMAKFHHIRQGTWCSVCHKQRLKMGIPSQRLTISQVKDKLHKLGFEFLSNTYTNTTQKYDLKCSKGHVFSDKRLSSIFTGKVGCSFCNNSFNAEKKFRNTVENIFKKPFPKCRPNWLINPETGYKLELDCYNEELRLAFEYDGQFHFEVRKGINNNLENTKKLDRLKDKLCLENNITLIRVPYFLKDKEFYNKLIEGFKAMYGDNYFYIIRSLDNGVPCPPEIKAARQAAREKVVK